MRQNLPSLRAAGKLRLLVVEGEEKGDYFGENNLK